MSRAPEEIGYDNPAPDYSDDDTPVATTSNNKAGTKADEEANNGSKDAKDFSIPGLDMNQYATKKTFAQGMLDLALLAANASQLKYLLGIGESHQFYTLLLTLIITSISLQVLEVLVCVVLALILNINKTDEQRSADIINNVGLAIIVVIVVINVVISAFDMKGDDNIK